MRTLSRWTYLLKIPLTIDCPVMNIIGQDYEDPIFSGSGQIHIRSRTRIDFLMHARLRDGREAFERINKSQKNPHDIFHQFRLSATQYDGTEWNCGWISLVLGETFGDTWQITGVINSLVTTATGHSAPSTSGIEVIYTPKLALPFPLTMTTSIQRNNVEVLRKMEPGGKTLEVAGTQIDFFSDPELDATWGAAATSRDFCHPHAENWISEPLCLLLGQLVFPRLVARNFGDHSTIWLRPTPTISMDTLAASILQEDPLGAHGRFWDVYNQILTMLIRARNRNDERNFEAHPLTHYYHEIIQATGSSNWAWCLTLASAVEGTANLLTPKSERKSDYATEDIDGLKNHIKTWKGDENLRGRILNSVAFAETKGLAQIFSNFKNEGLIDESHITAWLTVRNRVMHGELVTPWSDKGLEEQMRLLAELMHRLSMRYIEKCSS